VDPPEQIHCLHHNQQRTQAISLNVSVSFLTPFSTHINTGTK
jgi:hypothetical protein